MAVTKKDLIKDLYKSLFKDYQTDTYTSSHSLKKQCDRLAGFAHIALEALEAEGKADFVFLKHDDIRNWWTERKLEITRQEQARIARQRKAELKAQALAKLTKEEREALGIKK